MDWPLVILFGFLVGILVGTTWVVGGSVLPDAGLALLSKAGRDSSI